MNDKDPSVNDIRFADLNGIEDEQIIALMNNPLVGKLLPLLGNSFSADDCRTFKAAKKKLWDEFGFGPWAFMIEDNFAGWGGLQPENGDADFALILHPDYWGWGRKIFSKVKHQAFNQMAEDLETSIIAQERGKKELQTAKEIAESASRAKSDFLSRVSHEFRTPMNGVIGMTDFVLDTELSSEQRESLEMVKTSADSLLTLISGIFDYSKIEAEIINIEPIDFNLRDNINETLSALILRAAEKGLASVAAEILETDKGCRRAHRVRPAKAWTGYRTE